MYGQSLCYTLQTKTGKASKLVISQDVVQIGIGSEETIFRFEDISTVTCSKLELCTLFSRLQHGRIVQGIALCPCHLTAGGYGYQSNLASLFFIVEDCIATLLCLGGQMTTQRTIFIITLISISMQSRGKVLHRIVSSSSKVKEISILRHVERERFRETLGSLIKFFFIIDWQREILGLFQGFKSQVKRGL